MLRALERWRRIGVDGRHLTLEALLLVVYVRCALWCSPFAQVEQRFHPRSPIAAQRRNASGDAEQVAEAVRRAARRVPGASCLTQALATRVALGRRGVVGELRIGVAKDASGMLEAHAWIEFEGRVLIGDLPDLARFQPLPPLRGDAV